MTPTHCPNCKCKYFTPENDDNWYFHYGYYETKTFGRVPRFKCRSCGKTFSSQTFSIDYYAKKKVFYPYLLDQLFSCSGNRDIARKFGIRDSVVQNRIERLSRWAQGFHNLMLKQLPLDESLAADGFESFSYSQYYPNNINIIAGRDSQFLYSTGLSILRRKGKMTNAQKKRRAELEQQGKASSSMTYSSMKNLGDGLANLLINKEIGNALLWTDEHRSYSGAFRSQGVFQHLRVSSKKARTFKNPLFAVNYLDRQFRKDLSDHTRETVQFAHHPACMMNRLILYRHFHNYIKPYRIKEQKENRMPKSTHGEEAGLDKDYLLEMKTQLEGKRFFYSKLDLDREEMQTWMQGWKNPGLNSTRYVPKYITV